MERPYVSGALSFDQTDPLGGGAPISSWLLAGSLPLFSARSGGNVAGNGGNGYFVGSLLDSSDAAFKPFNAADSGGNATADAHQTNIAYSDETAVQTAGVGGDGGNHNAALGGAVEAHGPVGNAAIGTGDNGAGNGGNGYFSGAIVDTANAVYSPINIAVAGSHGSADAQQSNTVHIDQSAVQTAGIGGHGGNDNAAVGGHITMFGVDHGAHQQGWIGSDVIATGGNSAGNGVDGYFAGSIVHESFALYDPINIAVAQSNSSAHAEQTNNVDFNQAAFQMAGVGGQGGNDNTALGGHLDVFSSNSNLTGFDGIATGGNSAGDGGSGHFTGSLVDVNIAIYAPINIAVAGYKSTATADQTNNVHFDQSATQVAGIGGDGGHGNAALGGDIVALLLADHHLVDHVA
jgi:hypothetical protein